MLGHTEVVKDLKNEVLKKEKLLEEHQMKKEEEKEELISSNNKSILNLQNVVKEKDDMIQQFKDKQKKKQSTGEFELKNLDDPVFTEYVKEIYDIKTKY